MPWWGWLALWIAVSVIFGLGYVTGAIMAKGAHEDEATEQMAKEWSASVRALLDKEQKGTDQTCTRCKNPVGSATLAIGGHSKWVCEWCGMIQPGEEAVKGALPM